MPTYEYECKSCGHSFDAFQKMSDPPLSLCPQCGKEVRRIINGGSGIIFKGSGFYVTDKKGGTESSTSPAKATTKPAAASDSGGNTKTEINSASSGNGLEKKVAG
jgi:putative FmdB family regulatory protein